MSLAMADSVNPVTIAVALYLASSGSSSSRLAGFAAGVFGAYAPGGVVLMLGPGELLDTPHASSGTRGFHAASIALGAGMLIAALILLRRRPRSARASSLLVRLDARSAFVLGAAVTAVDLPTAFPYLAAIAAIAASGATAGAQLALLAVFNLIYVLPLALILAARTIVGGRCDSVLRRPVKASR